jgi:hypothetical protein
LLHGSCNFFTEFILSFGICYKKPSTKAGALMKILWTTLILLLSFSSFAQEDFPTARAQCNRLSGSEDRLQCLSSVSRARSFNPLAVTQCSRLSTASDIVLCIEAAADTKPGSAGEPMGQCSRMSSVNDIIDCVKATKGKTYSVNDMNECNRYSTVASINQCLRTLGSSSRRRTPEPRALEAASAQCNRISSTESRLLCLGAVSGARSFNLSAIAQCNRMSTADSIVSCMEAAANTRVPGEADPIVQCNRMSTVEPIIECIRATQGKTYTSADMSECNRYSSTETIIQCLESLGRKN